MYSYLYCADENAYIFSYRSIGYISRPQPPLRCVAKSTKSAHAIHLGVGRWEPFRKGDVVTKWFSFTNHPMRMCGFRGFATIYTVHCGASRGNFTGPLNDMTPGKIRNKIYICFMLIRSAILLATFGTKFHLNPTCNFEENPTQTRDMSMSKFPVSVFKTIPRNDEMT
jgi:hypothetical protein